MRVVARSMLLVTMVLAGGGWNPSAEWRAQMPASTIYPALPKQKFGSLLDEKVVRHLPENAAEGVRLEPCEAGPEGCRMLVSISSAAPNA